MGRGPEQTFFQRRHNTGGQPVQEKVPSITNHQENAHQNHKGATPTWEAGYCQKKEMSAGEDVEKREDLRPVGGM